MSASWTSFTTVRLSALLLLGLGLGERPPEIARAADELRDPLALVDEPVPLGACILGEPEHPHRVLLAHPDERRRHGEVVVDPGEGHRPLDRPAADRRGRLDRGLAVPDPKRRPAEQVA